MAAPMPSVLSRAMRLLVEVPKHGKLAYCLLRDERVPRAHKGMLLAALGVIVSPIDFPAWVPLFGELDMLALGIVAVQTFIEACPEDVRREHMAALAAGESVFDRDFRDTVSAARGGAGRVFEQIRRRVQRRNAYKTVSEG